MTPPDAPHGDTFGYVVAVTNDLLVAGAPWDSERGAQAGAVYVFRRNDQGTPENRSDDTWDPEAKLTASDAQDDDEFGSSVAIDGNACVIGAYFNDERGSNAGAAYVFTRSGDGVWTEQKLTAEADAKSGALFGISVAISGRRLIVGASETTTDPFPGEAFIFRLEGTSWVREAKLMADEPSNDDKFGIAVAIDGDLALIGASGSNQDAGAAYAFRREGTGWIAEQQLVGSDTASGDHFGYRLSLSGQRALIGAFLHDHTGSDAGAAYFFERAAGTWSQTTERWGETTGGEWFGHGVAIRGDLAVVGARRDAGQGFETGAAYVFKALNGGWEQTAKLTASDASAGANFGNDVACSVSGTAVCGAFGVDTTYVFTADGPDCNENGQTDDCDIRNGTSQDQNANGIPDECVCDGIKRFKAKTRVGHGRCRILASVLTSLALGTPITFCFEPDPACGCLTVLINDAGRARARCTTLLKGEHRVYIQECPDLQRTVTCDP